MVGGFELLCKLVMSRKIRCFFEFFLYLLNFNIIFKIINTLKKLLIIILNLIIILKIILQLKLKKKTLKEHMTFSVKLKG
jgi:hypothetical protein